MKRRLNILCVLVVVLLAYPVFEYGYYFGLGASMGMKMQGDRKRTKELMNMQVVALNPKTFEFTDSVYNEVSGKTVPAIYGQLVVNVPMKPNLWMLMASKTLPLFSVFASLAALVIFIRLIISINKLDIFTWRNVRRLRWIGGLLVFAYFCMLVTYLLVGVELSGVFALRGYSFHQSELASFLTIVLGVVSFIVAEVISIGLKIKEEQDLTI